jgi:hypothetical protein
MSVDAHIYVGAFLKIGNTFQEVEYVGVGCPKHGQMNHKFCPKCGAKIESCTLKEWKEKSIEPDKIRTGLDQLSNFDSKDTGGYVILVPYRDNTGELVKTYDETFVETPTIDTSVYIKQLKEKESEYIKWLIAEKFEVIPSFGVILYYS